MIILASSSPYRRMLLRRLALDFTVFSPSIDETPLPDETPAGLVSRLAKEKALAVSGQHPDALVIGSDQLAIFEDRIIGKPGSVHKAVEQLQQFSGHCVQFLTAVAVNCTASGFFSNSTISTDVCFRVLDNAEIKRYVVMDNPLDCAGGFKSEAAGSTLLTHLRSDDPAAIIGLPLICLSAMLREAGIRIP
ncbi:MAG: Maf family nucleotide pyrophosphatase [Xanthomonadales bacterium]